MTNFLFAAREVGNLRWLTSCADDYDQIEVKRSKLSHLCGRKAYECVILPSSDTNDVISSFFSLYVPLLIAYFHHNAASCLKVICLRFFYTLLHLLRRHPFRLFSEFRSDFLKENKSLWGHSHHKTCLFVRLYRSTGKIISPVHTTPSARLRTGSFCQITVNPVQFNKRTGLINSSQRCKQRKGFSLSTDPTASS